MDFIKRCEIERDEKWMECIKKMPYIQFPKDYSICVIPPFGGALARFKIKLPCGTEKSIYADFYDRLGVTGLPYWEVYPYQDDVGRCAINDVDKLLKMIADTSDGKTL